MLDPRTMSPGSIMPQYPWLLDNKMKTDDLAGKIKALRTLGVPYEAGYEKQALADLQAQAQKVAKNLADQGIKDQGIEDKEIIAIIAYLQRLGTDIKVEKQGSK